MKAGSMLGLMRASPQQVADAILGCILSHLMVLMRAMREVEASNAHSSPQEVFQDFHAPGLWTQRADDLHTTTLSCESQLAEK